MRYGERWVDRLNGMTCTIINTMFHRDTPEMDWIEVDYGLAWRKCRFSRLDFMFRFDPARNELEEACG